MNDLPLESLKLPGMGASQTGFGPKLPIMAGVEERIVPHRSSTQNEERGTIGEPIPESLAIDFAL